MKKFIIFLSILNILTGKESHPLNPMKPTYFATRRGFAYASDHCSHIDWSLDLSSIGDFFLKYPKAFRKNEYNSPEFYEMVFSYLVSRANDGDILWIDPPELEIFLEKIVPKMEKKLILIIAGVLNFPDGCGLSSEYIDKFLETDSIIHIFAQNNNYQGVHKDKISYLPIGLEYSRGILYRGTPTAQEQPIKRIISKSRKTTERSIRICCDFALSSNRGDRKDALDALIRNDVADILDQRIDRTKLWEIKSNKAFDVSPQGYGQDCFRTWESLALGCIVIVKTSFLDPLYEGLPVVIVKDWNEITQENLEKWLAEYGDVSHKKEMRKRLTHKYWMDKIYKVQKKYRSQKTAKSDA